MTKPTNESVELAKTIMDVGTPLVDYVAVIIGTTMEINHTAVVQILDEHREDFEGLGADDLLKTLEDRFDTLFRGFFNEEGSETLSA